jgi:MYXO-CTERM domain-containing protein
MEASTHKGVFVTGVQLPAGIMPGTYSPSIDCSNGLAGTGTLVVKAAVTPNVVVPSGAPVTGDGVTSTAMGGPLTAVGVSLLGLSGLAGAFAIRRRRAAK